MNEKIQKLVKKQNFHIILIITVGILVYSNTCDVPFIFDDLTYIADNPVIKDLKYFGEPLKTSEIKIPDKPIIVLFKTRFIAFLSFAMNYKIHGLSVTGYHIFNLLIHILNAILVYWLVMLTFRTPNFKVSATIIRDQTQKTETVHSRLLHLVTYLPLFIALLFVSHPIQTQAVTYIWQRVTSLATFFYLLSLVMYINFRLWVIGNRTAVKPSTYRPSPITYYLLSLLSALLAMLTKEIAFTLPVIIILYEFIFFNNFKEHGKIFRRLFYLTPFLFTMLIIPLSRLAEDSAGNISVSTKELTDMSRWDYLFTQFRVITTYIRLLFFPINQNLDYDYPTYNSFLEPAVFVSFIFLLALFGLGIYLFKVSVISVSKQTQKTDTVPSFTHLPIHRLTAFGLFWFFITLAVESSVIPIRDVIFEHRIYLPSIGAFIAIIIFIFIAINKLRIEKPKLYKAVALSLSVSMVVLSAATYHRNNVWQSTLSLWDDVTRKSPEKASGFVSLGNAYRFKGQMDKSIESYLIALKLDPDYALAYINLGIAYASKGLTDKSIESYLIALKLDPDYALAYIYLGIAYASKGLPDKAIEHFEIALKLKPDYAEAYNYLANIYMSKRLSDTAIEHYQTAIKLKPDYAEAYNNLGVAYRSKGSIDKAMEYYNIALRLKPDYVEAYSNLGNIYYSLNVFDKAIEYYTIALRLRPDFADARYNLNAAYYKANRLKQNKLPYP